MNQQNMSDRLHKIRINEAINQIRSLLTVKKNLTNLWINEQIIQWIDESINKKSIKWLIFVAKTNVLIPISSPPGGVNLWYLKHRLFDLTETTVWSI